MGFHQDYPAQWPESHSLARRACLPAYFTFHGVGGDYLAVSNQAHAELLAYLAAHRDIYWTDTFLNLMTYVRQQQAAHARLP